MSRATHYVLWLFTAAVVPAAAEVTIWLTKTLEGQQFQSQRRFADAEKAFLSALHDADQLGPSNPAASVVLDNLGNLYSELRRPSDAECMYKRSLRSLQQIVGSEHTLFATVQSHLARVYLKSFRYAQAKPLLGSSLAIQMRERGEDSLEVARIQNDLAAIYVAEHRDAEAGIVLQCALRTFERHPGTRPVDIGTVLHNLAFLAKNKGDIDTALRYTEQAMGVFERQPQPPTPMVVYTLVLLGEVYAIRRDPEQSRLRYNSALALAERAYGSDDAAVADVLTAYAAGLRKLHSRHEAARLDARAKRIRARLRLNATSTYTVDLRALRPDVWYAK